MELQHVSGWLKHDSNERTGDHNRFRTWCLSGESVRSSFNPICKWSQINKIRGFAAPLAHKIRSKERGLWSAGCYLHGHHVCEKSDGINTNRLRVRRIYLLTLWPDQSQQDTFNEFFVKMYFSVKIAKFYCPRLYWSAVSQKYQRERFYLPHGECGGGEAKDVRQARWQGKDQ